jgi:multidrug efflux pump subunit AcrB
MDELRNTPLLLASAGANASGLAGTATSSNATGTGALNLLSNVGTVERGFQQSVANHNNTLPVLDIYANVQDRDLGSVERDIRKIVDGLRGELAPGNTIEIRGQIGSKNAAFTRIGLGLCFGLVAVYLLMVINYQTWMEPLVVLLALPIAFCGMLAALFITGTTLSIPSLMGALMSVGVASANSILLVTFAKEHREATHCSAMEAALAAGSARLRPVLMTAGAMFVGLLPMALALGDGSESNGALARAVMGGVLLGTCSTLLFVPFLYATLRRKATTGMVKDYL